MSSSELPSMLPTVHERLEDELQLARGIDIPKARPLIDAIRADTSDIVAKAQRVKRFERGATLEVDKVKYFGSGQGNKPTGPPAEEEEPEKP